MSDRINKHIYPKQQVIYSLLTIIAAHLLIFLPHYLGKSSFTWDFNLTYHAVPYFVVEAIKNGIFPEWVPMQGGGYPLFLNRQSYALYPIFNLLGLLKISYTLYLAVIIQCLHILFGTLGAYVLALKLKFDWRVALLFALGFHQFGGIFTGSEYPDIVRASCFLPWIAASLITVQSPLKSIFTLTILPLSIGLLWLGGYPGNAISFTFILFVFLLIRFLLKKMTFGDFFQFGLLALLGLGVASAWILPGLLLKSEILRNISFSNESKYFFSLKQFFALFQPIFRDTIPTDISMRGFSLTIPIAIGLFGLTLTDIKKRLDLCILFLILLLISSGTVVYDFLVWILPPLGLSRFPISDYRILLFFIILYFASVGLQNLFTKQFKDLKSKIIFIFFIYILSYLMLLDAKSDWLFLMGSFLALTLSILFYIKQFSGKKFFIYLILLIVLDHYRINSSFNYWQDNSVYKKHAQYFGDLSTTSANLADLFNGLSSRSERLDLSSHGPIDNSSEMAFQGYLNGKFILQDYSGPTKFKRFHDVVNDKQKLKFLLASWCSNNKNFNLECNLSSDVKIEKYSVNTITYEVKNSPTYFFENEIYYPGWQFTENLSTIVRDVDNKEGFRLFKDLNKDTKSIKAVYKTPGLKMGFYVSLISFLIWITFVLVRFKAANAKLKLPDPTHPQTS